MWNPTALLISVVSLSVAGAAWWTNREKLRLDLYNRRFDIYSHTLDFVHAIELWQPTESEKASASLQDSLEMQRIQKAFVKASREAQFLFDDDSGVQKTLEKVHADTIALIGYKRDLLPKLTGPDVVPAFGELERRQKQIYDSIPALERGMSKYLDFHGLSVWRSRK